MVEAAETRKHEGFMTKLKRKKMERDMKKGKTGSLGTGATTVPVTSAAPFSTTGFTPAASTNALPAVSQPVATGVVGAIPVSTQSGVVSGEAPVANSGLTNAPLFSNTQGMGMAPTTTGFIGDNNFSDKIAQKKHEHDFKSGKRLSPEDQGEGHVIENGGYKWKQTSHFTGENIDNLNYRKVE